MPTKPENCEYGGMDYNANRTYGQLRRLMIDIADWIIYIQSVCTVFEDEIWREIQNDRTYLRVYGVVGDVEGLAAPQVLVRHRRGLLAVNLVREVDVAALHEPVGRRVVAIVGQEVVVELPEDV